MRQPDSESDEALARRVQWGDPDAMERLVRRYVRAVHAVAAAFLSEPADVEDAAQDSFLRALRGIARYDPRRPFAPWLYQITRNVALTRLESRGRARMEVVSEDLASELPGPELLAERSRIAADVRAAIARLPEQRRTAFWMCDVEGYATGEVARIMNLAPGTIRAHVHHARKALRAALARQHEPASDARGRR